MKRTKKKEAILKRNAKQSVNITLKCNGSKNLMVRNITNRTVLKCLK